MSLTKDKKAAHTALATLKDVAASLPHEKRQDYMTALDMVARYNGSLRRQHKPVETIVVPDNSSKAELQDLRNQVNQLRQNLDFERRKMTNLDTNVMNWMMLCRDMFDHLDTHGECDQTTQMFLEISGSLKAMLLAFAYKLANQQVDVTIRHGDEKETMEKLAPLGSEAIQNLVLEVISLFENE